MVIRPMWGLALIAAGASMVMADDFNLNAIHEDIVARYTGVQHIHSSALDTLHSDDVVLFDVRERAEYTVSHLRNALRLDPSIAATEFIDAHEERLQGKTIVFYCSVGHRSSAKALELAEALDSAGAAAVYNLEGGIFKWHNDNRPLVSGNAPTRDVHPYNRRWGKLVDDATALKYDVER